MNMCERRKVRICALTPKFLLHQKVLWIQGLTVGAVSLSLEYYLTHD